MNRGVFPTVVYAKDAIFSAAFSVCLLPPTGSWQWRIQDFWKGGGASGQRCPLPTGVRSGDGLCPTQNKKKEILLLKLRIFVYSE